MPDRSEHGMVTGMRPVILIILAAIISTSSLACTSGSGDPSAADTSAGDVHFRKLREPDRTRVFEDDNDRCVSGTQRWNFDKARDGWGGKHARRNERQRIAERGDRSSKRSESSLRSQPSIVPGRSA